MSNLVIIREIMLIQIFFMQLNWFGIDYTILLYRWERVWNNVF